VSGSNFVEKGSSGGEPGFSLALSFEVFLACVGIRDEIGLRKVTA
jgi:hypothetical protein